MTEPPAPCVDVDELDEVVAVSVVAVALLPPPLDEPLLPPPNDWEAIALICAY